MPLPQKAMQSEIFDFSEMERSFSQFGHADHFNFDTALGLNDTQAQLEEIRDIESYLPHFKISYLNPSPIGKFIKIFESFKLKVLTLS